MDSPVWYLLKIGFIYMLLLLDIVLNSSINSDNYDFIAQNDFWPFLFIVYVKTALYVLCSFPCQRLL